MRRSLACLVLLWSVVPVAAARAELRPSRAKAAEAQLRQTIRETRGGRSGRGQTRALRATALNAIALADDPQRILRLILPHLQGDLAGQVRAAARVRELRMAGKGHGRLGRLLGEVTEDGTLTAFGAWRVRRAGTQEIAVSREPRKLLESAQTYFEPLFATGQVDARLTAVLDSLRTATEAREAELAARKR